MNKNFIPALIVFVALIFLWAAIKNKNIVFAVKAVLQGKSIDDVPGITTTTSTPDNRSQPTPPPSAGGPAIVPAASHGNQYAA